MLGCPSYSYTWLGSSLGISQESSFNWNSCSIRFDEAVGSQDRLGPRRNQIYCARHSKVLTKDYFPSKGLSDWTKQDDSWFFSWHLPPKLDHIGNWSVTLSKGCHAKLMLAEWCQINQSLGPSSLLRYYWNQQHQCIHGGPEMAFSCVCTSSFLSHRRLQTHRPLSEEGGYRQNTFTLEWSFHVYLQFDHSYHSYSSYSSEVK